MSLFGRITFNSGATQNQQNSSNPSGSSTTASAPATGGLFGSTTKSQPQQSGNLFGNTSTSQPQQSSGLFGSTSTSQPQQSGSLFGNTSTSQPQQGGGLFGSTTANSGQQGGGLFGSTTQQSSQPQQSTSLFGNTTQNQSGSSLFGGNTQNQQQAKPSLFGGLGANTTNNQQQQQSSLFGNNASQRSTGPVSGSTFRSGGLTLGQSANQQQQTVPGVKIDISNVRGTTRFNDLHEELQKQIENVDNFIQQQVAYKEQCDALIPSHENTINTIPGDVEYVRDQVETVESTLDNDSSAVNQVKTIVQRDVDNARVAFRTVENLKLPQQFHYSGVWQNISPPRPGLDPDSTDGTPTDLLSFFDSTSSSLSSTMQRYQANLTEIENHLGVVEANTNLQAQQLMFRRGKEGGARSKDDQVRELSNVLREFESGIVQVAETVGRVREQVVDAIEGGNDGVEYGRR